MAKIIPLKKTKITPKFKYTLEEQISALPRSMSIMDVVKHLEKDKISRNEFYADRAIPFGSAKSIPSDRLFIYSKVFECPVEDLMNHSIKATSIRSQSFRKLKTSLS